MSTVNRRDIARRISDNTGYFIKDIEDILDAEAEAIEELLLEGHTKIKNHKFLQIEVVTRPPKKAWNGLAKEYYMLPEKQILKFKPLSQLDKIEKELNEE